MRNNTAEILLPPEERDPVRLAADPDADLALRTDLVHALRVMVVRMSARASDVAEPAR
jgi:hypothetical protein